MDEHAAPIVQRIFRSALAGQKLTHIAAALNKEGIPTPLERLSEKKGIRIRVGTKKMWTGPAISRILRDIRYTGATTHGMFGMERMGSKKRRSKPKHEWIIHEGMHEALISKEDFEMMQARIRKNKKSESASRPSRNSLPVPVRCGGCGHAMIKTVQKTSDTTAITKN